MEPRGLSADYEKTLEHLRGKLVPLRTLHESSRPPHLESKDLSLINSVEELLDLHANDHSLAVTWCYGKMLVTALTKTKITDARMQQKISSALLKSLNWKDSTAMRRESQDILALIVETEHFHFFSGTVQSRSQTCLFSSFLTKCFELMGNEKESHYYSSMIQISCYPTLLYLKEQEGQILHQVLDVIFQQLIAPSCRAVSKVVELVLHSCRWRIADPVREMFVGRLISGELVDNYAPFVSCQSSKHIYKIILKLVKISKDLVIGLINNTELCLENGREDRLIGLEFFCDLFGSTSLKSIPNTCDFFSCLWQEFLHHCLEVSLHEPRELLLIASHTGTLLKQPNAHQDWCHLLYDLFEYVIAPDCEQAFILGITDALQHDLSLANRDNAKSLMLLIKEFLTPGSRYERQGKARDLLLRTLGKIYTKQAVAGARNVTLHIAHHMCSKLLTCFVGICAHPFGTTSANWTVLRELFVTSLVPSSVDYESRMKCLLNMWIQAGEDDRVYLHELFVKTRRARSALACLLLVQNDKEAAKNLRMYIPAYKLDLFLLLTKIERRSEFYKLFLHELSSSSELKQMLQKLYSVQTSCTENQKASEEIISFWQESVGMDNKDILQGLLFYLAEVTFDAESMKFLIELVRSCVLGDEIASGMGLNRLHVARASLKLLNEVLLMVPQFGFLPNVLANLLKWSNISYGSLSELALCCLNTMSSFYKLADKYPHLTKNVILPQCLQIIETGSRGQVKRAMACLSQHTSSNRDVVLHKVLSIISLHLQDLSNEEAFERGVSALGHFSILCPSSLKAQVEKLCVSVLLQRIIEPYLNEPQYESSSLNISSNTWVDWQDLPFHILIKVQALRSIGRSLRYCGSTSSVSTALEILQKVIHMPQDDAPPNYREVDVAYLRCEASSAVLFILEEAKFHPLISTQLLLGLSQILRDTRMEVRSFFAQKLCHGLSPHKVWSNIDKKRGHLPPCLMGILPLLGTNLWMNDRALKKEAEQLLQEVFFSRYYDQHKALLLSQGLQRKSNFYERDPLLVLENIFAISVPILAENICEFTGVNVNLESMEEVANCFKFTCSMLCHNRTYGGQVHRDYLTKMLTVAKGRVNLPEDPSLIKKYAVVFQLMEVALKCYRPHRKEPLFPSFALPPPFFNQNESVIDDEMVYESILSEADLKRLEISVFKGRKQQGDLEESEHEVDNSVFSEIDFTDNSFSTDFMDQCQEQQNVHRSGSISKTSLDFTDNSSTGIRSPPFFSTPLSSADRRNMNRMNSKRRRLI